MMRLPLISSLALLAAACSTTRSLPSAAAKATPATITAAGESGVAPGVPTARDRSSLEFMLGSRWMHDDDWKVDSGGYDINLKHQSVFGVGGATIEETAGIGPEWAVILSNAIDDDSVSGNRAELEATTVELAYGLRKSFWLEGPRFEPYFGGGLALITALIKDSGETADFELTKDDAALGVYGHAGLNYYVDDSMSLGLDFRTVLGSQFLDALDGLSADYSQFLFVIGFTN